MVGFWKRSHELLISESEHLCHFICQSKLFLNRWTISLNHLFTVTDSRRRQKQMWPEKIQQQVISFCLLIHQSLSRKEEIFFRKKPDVWDITRILSTAKVRTLTMSAATHEKRPMEVSRGITRLVWDWYNSWTSAVKIPCPNNIRR